MSIEKDDHLSETQLLISLVDERDLDHELRKHLITCPLCLNEKDRLEEGLSRMGRLADEFTPHSSRRPLAVCPPEEQDRLFTTRLKGWRGSFVIGLVTAALILVVGPLFFKTGIEERQAMLQREMVEDVLLMAEIERLERNVLAFFYAGIWDDPDTYQDDDFMDFVVPAPEADIRSFNGREKDRAC